MKRTEQPVASRVIFVAGKRAGPGIALFLQAIGHLCVSYFTPLILK
jgi:hypothetical protein